MPQLANIPSLFTDANLVSYWKLEDTADSKGNNTLTNNNSVTFTAGKFGGSAAFVSASSQYLSVANAALRVNGTKTLMGWIKLANVTDTHTVPFGTSNSASTQDFRFRQFQAQIFADCDPLSASGQVLASGLVAGSWYHVAMVYDSTANTVKGYFNGNLVINSTGVTGTPDQSATDFAIGRNGANAASYFNGEVDDVAFFNRALTAIEIQSLIGLTDHLVSYWKLDGNFTDLISAYNLTTTGTPGDVAGKRNNAKSFVAATSYASIAGASAPNLNITRNAITVSAWARPTNIAGGWGHGYISSKRNTVNNNSGWYLALESGNIPRFFIGNGTSAASVPSVSTVSNNIWYHIVGVYDGVNARIYFNGASEATGALTGAIGDTASTPFYIGRNSLNAGEGFTGDIDEVGIWNRVLTAAEVSRLYNNGLGLSYPFADSGGAFLQNFI